MASGGKHVLPALPLSPLEPVARTLKYDERTEHLVRRLGSALVLQWDGLSDELQDLIIDQAVLVEDRTDGPHQCGDIEAFIRTARSIPLRAPVQRTAIGEAAAK
jgi:hypothetical protein